MKINLGSLNRSLRVVVGAALFRSQVSVPY